MNKLTRRVFGVAGFALMLATSASFAQQPPPVRIRGVMKRSMATSSTSSRATATC